MNIRPEVFASRPVASPFSMGSNDVLPRAQGELVAALLETPINENHVRVILKKLLNIDCPWNVKYPNHIFTEIITENCKETACLDRLTKCLEILEKYGRNLLKSIETRPSDWQNIDFNRDAFRTKVDIIKGARQIIHDLGYTQPTLVGVSYVHGTQPNQAQVARVLADIMMVHHELLGYRYDTHPHMHVVDRVLPAHLRKCNVPIKPTSNFTLPTPTWKASSEPVSSQEDEAISCHICGRPPEWSCHFCDNKLLCDSCDHMWHSHQKRNKHYRNNLTRSLSNSSTTTTTPATPITTATPAPVTNGGLTSGLSWPKLPTDQSLSPKPNAAGEGQSACQLPTVLESVRTMNSGEGDRLRLEIQTANSTTEKDQIPSGLPCLSVFLGSPESPNNQSAKLSEPPQASEASGDTKVQGAEAPRESRKVQLERELTGYRRRLEEIDDEIKEIIRIDSNFFRNPEYKALRAERRREDDLLAGVEANLQVIQEEEEYLKTKVAQTEMAQWKNHITTPPAVYVPPPSFTFQPKHVGQSSEKAATVPSGSLFDVSCSVCHTNMSSREQVCIACGAQLPKSTTSPILKRQGSQTSTHSSISPRSLDISLNETKLKWRCDACTFDNEPSVKKKCSICLSVSKNPQYVDENGRIIDVSQPITTPSRSGSESMAAFFQRQEEDMMLEKRRAKQQDDEKIKDQSVSSPPSAFHYGGVSTWGATRAPPPTSPLSGSSTWGGSKAPPRRSQSEFKMSKVSGSPEPDMKTTRSVGSHLASLSKTLDRDNLAEQQRRELRFQGEALIHKIRMAEKENFTPEEFELAYGVVGEEGDVMQWLRTAWRPTLEEVVRQVAGLNVPPMRVSWEEARQALLLSMGDRASAMQRCVHSRLEKVAEVLKQGQYNEQAIHDILELHDGSVEQTLATLNERALEPFTHRHWDELDTTPIKDPKFTDALMDESVDQDRRLRMLLAEGNLQYWGISENVLRLLRRSRGEGRAEGEDWSAVHLKDIVDVVTEVGDFRRAISLLQQQCSVCLCMLPHSKLRSLVFCECRVCGPCLCQYFEIQVREHHVRHWICPVCSQPDIEDEEKRDAHFQFMELLLKNVVKQDVYDLFQKKLRDWSLMNDPNFRWCSHCDFGFLFDSEDGTLKMTCPKCNRHTCFQCKKHWEDQHENITCDQFQAWKEANDPELQTQGLAKILAENGIDCPACKFRYALAKGGCMHFKCTQCQHEFCSGCHKPFKRGETCSKFDTCKQEGLHCHHPRDCLFYLRDFNVNLLQKLLKDHQVPFNTAPAAGGSAGPGGVCPVMEQKEQVDGLTDEACGKRVPNNHAGLCEVHYKEYLVTLINKHGIDPMEIMTEDELLRLLKKNKIPATPKRKKDSAQEYRLKLTKAIKEKLPLAAPTPAKPPVVFPQPVGPRPPAAAAPRPAVHHPLELGIRRIPEENAEEAVHWI